MKKYLIHNIILIIFIYLLGTYYENSFIHSTKVRGIEIFAFVFSALFLNTLLKLNFEDK